MGLDFGIQRLELTEAHWSYGGFNEFRRRLAREIDVDLDRMVGFGIREGRHGDRRWSSVNDPIVPLLDHADCEGDLDADDCAKVGPRLRELVAKWPADDYDRIHAELLADAMEECATTEGTLVFT